APAEITERFGPTQADYDAVRTYFELQGLTTSDAPGNRMTLSVSGTRTVVANALHVDITDYRIGDKRFYANSADPSLPLAIAARVEAIAGLNSLAVPQPSWTAILTPFCKFYAYANSQKLET